MTLPVRVPAVFDEPGVIREETGRCVYFSVARNIFAESVIGDSLTIAFGKILSVICSGRTEGLSLGRDIFVAVGLASVIDRIKLAVCLYDKGAYPRA